MAQHCFLHSYANTCSAHCCVFPAKGPFCRNTGTGEPSVTLTWVLTITQGAMYCSSICTMTGIKLVSLNEVWHVKSTRSHPAGTMKSTSTHSFARQIHPCLLTQQNSGGSLSFVGSQRWVYNNYVYIYAELCMYVSRANTTLVRRSTLYQGRLL